MADAATTNVTTVLQWRTGSPAGKFICGKLVRVTGGTFGGNTNKIPASAFGFRRLVWASNGIVSNNAKVYAAQVSYGGAHVTLTDLTQATDASRVPADVNLSSETIEMTVFGI